MLYFWVMLGSALGGVTLQATRHATHIAIEQCHYKEMS
jgi:hypothetical protein